MGFHNPARRPREILSSAFPGESIREGVKNTTIRRLSRGILPVLGADKYSIILPDGT